MTSNVTYTKLTATPNAEEISIIEASSSKFLLTMRSTAKNTKIPVTTHISITDVNAPMT